MYPLGAVTLPVTVGDYPQQIMRDVTFLVVDCSSAYNAILGHPILNSWKAVTSTYHLMIRFPTEYGVGEVRGDQVVVREYYIAMLEMDNHQQTMCIEEQRAAEPVEELEEVTLDDSRPERTTRVGTLARQLVRNELMTFLRENQDAFTQSHKDMPGIDADFIREVYYPDWLANVVMVKKANEKWRMSVDFTDFNIACPKDSYPLPRIDTLVDLTARH